MLVKINPLCTLAYKQTTQMANLKSIFLTKMGHTKINQVGRKGSYLLLNQKCYKFWEFALHEDTFKAQLNIHLTLTP
jgi:hypothetical protein